jgi:hypothetical protein
MATINSSPNPNDSGFNDSYNYTQCEYQTDTVDNSSPNYKYNKTKTEKLTSINEQVNKNGNDVIEIISNEEDFVTFVTTKTITTKVTSSTSNHSSSTIKTNKHDQNNTSNLSYNSVEINNNANTNTNLPNKTSKKHNNKHKNKHKTKENGEHFQTNHHKLSNGFKTTDETDSHSEKEIRISVNEKTEEFLYRKDGELMKEEEKCGGVINESVNVCNVLEDITSGLINMSQNHNQHNSNNKQMNDATLSKKLLDDEQKKRILHMRSESVHLLFVHMRDTRGYINITDNSLRKTIKESLHLLYHDKVKSYTELSETLYQKDVINANASSSDVKVKGKSKRKGNEAPTGTTYFLISQRLEDLLSKEKVLLELNMNDTCINNEFVPKSETSDSDYDIELVNDSSSTSSSLSNRIETEIKIERERQINLNSAQHLDEIKILEQPRHDDSKEIPVEIKSPDQSSNKRKKNKKTSLLCIPCTSRKWKKTIESTRIRSQPKNKEIPTTKIIDLPLVNVLTPKNTKQISTTNQLTTITSQTSEINDNETVSSVIKAAINDVILNENSNRTATSLQEDEKEKLEEGEFSSKTLDSFNEYQGSSEQNQNSHSLIPPLDYVHPTQEFSSSSQSKTLDTLNEFNEQTYAEVVSYEVTEEATQKHHQEQQLSEVEEINTKNAEINENDILVNGEDQVDNNFKFIPTAPSTPPNQQQQKFKTSTKSNKKNKKNKKNNSTSAEESGSKNAHRFENLIVEETSKEFNDVILNDDSHNKSKFEQSTPFTITTNHEVNSDSMNETLAFENDITIENGINDSFVSNSEISN